MLWPPLQEEQQQELIDKISKGEFTLRWASPPGRPPGQAPCCARLPVPGAAQRSPHTLPLGTHISASVVYLPVVGGAFHWLECEQLSNPLVSACLLSFTLQDHV